MRNLLLSLALFTAFDAVALFETETRFTVHVTDDLGNNVTGMIVGASTFLKHIPDEGFGTDKKRSLKLATDANGVVTFSLPCISGKISFGTKHGFPGFYWDRGHEIRFKEEKGKWQPWNPTVELKVMRIVNPIPLYTKTVELHKSKRIPEFGKPVGFDLLKADWVAPYGNGKVSDFIFTINVKLGGKTKERFGYQIHDSSFHVGFSNDSDGIQSVYANPNKGSVLRLPRLAPEQGYETNLLRRAYRHKDGARREQRDDQNYFFRVRVKKDESGNIVSALYGKIHSEFAWDWTGDLRFTYYLNPTPNDRNLEFDGKNNLFNPDWRDTSWPREP